MKTFFILFALTLLTSCNDAQRNRIKSSNAITVSESKYSSQLIAELVVLTEIGKKTLNFVHSEYDEEANNDYNCNINIIEGTFRYAISENKLTLTNPKAKPKTNLVFTKTDRLTTEGLIGTWEMEMLENNKADTVTTLIFSDLEEVRIKKVCNVK